MPLRAGRHGPELPYELLAGVVPVRKGWLVVPGKLVGVSLHPEAGEVVANFAEVIDHIPSYSVIAVMAPIGLGKRWTTRGRSCDREARKLVGWPHLGAIASPPGRLDLAKGQRAVGDVTSRRLVKAIGELDSEMQPYRQRTVYAVHSELSFFQLNGDKPPKYSKQSAAGLRERRRLLLNRLGTAEQILDDEIADVSARHLLDGTVALWTARRIIAKAATRLPANPEWDGEGLRMEWVR